jgi:hypothetical protein
MADRKGKQESPGTFAQLYDVQEQLNRRNAKPLGRPPKKTQRKPTTIHLTQAESRNLSKLHLLVSEEFSVNRSELVGIAIDVLASLMETEGAKLLKNGQIGDVEAFRRVVFDFIKS